jgi:hypothetical protein
LYREEGKLTEVKEKLLVLVNVVVMTVINLVIRATTIRQHDNCLRLKLLYYKLPDTAAV